MITELQISVKIERQIAKKSASSVGNLTPVTVSFDEISKRKSVSANNITLGFDRRFLMRLV
jgi:hypothetical protein